MKFAIIVVAYNRPVETRRLVDSVCRAEYEKDEVDLIVSIDKGKRQKEIAEAVKDIEWSHGDYSIIIHPERKGLRPHIFQCASYTEQYDAVIVLEDDLIVAKSFYLFARSACEYYKDDDRVSQISLYSYSVNEFEARPFYPARIDSDVYAMQVAQSWGECWTKDMWDRFKASKYYKSEVLENNENLHHRVNEWGKNSWKKNFSNYIVDSNTFVIYPYYSFTTNYSEAGEHCKYVVPDYHVVMLEDIKAGYSFVSLDKCVKYDAFFERIINEKKLPYNNLCLDLYGSKTNYKGYAYIASTKALPYKVVKSCGLILKPQENNLFTLEKGSGINIYELDEVDKVIKKGKQDILRYDYGYLPWRRSLRHGIDGMITAIQNKISKYKR